MLKPYYKNKNVDGIIKDISREEWFKVRSGMIRYNSSYSTLVSSFLVARPMVSKGFEPLSGVLNIPVEEEKNIVINHDSFKIKYLKKLIELTAKNNVELAFVGSPHFGKKNSDDLEVVKQLCNDYNIPFIDYYSKSEILSHPEWFKDKFHLNKEGAREYSAMVKNDINRLLNH